MKLRRPAAAEVSREAFIDAWRRLKSPIEVSRALGLSIRNVYSRRAVLAKMGIVLETEGRKATEWVAGRVHFVRRRAFDIPDGHVVIFSDPHFYPDQGRIALDALLEVIRQLKPVAVFCGGDALDGTQISRHDPTRGWFAPVTLKEQLDCMVSSMGEIETAAGQARKDVILAMTLGNHDARLSRYLAVHAPHVENLPGTKLEDYIPAWPLSWTIVINDNTILRHKPFRSGQNAPFNATLNAGKHTFSGHLHNAQVRVVPRFEGFQYGTDVGAFANPASEAFDYAEDTIPWVQAFAVATYVDRQLLWPELVYRYANRMWFRGAAL